MFLLNLVEHTQQQIETMILNKEYDANYFLPSEGELCKKFGVSRMTVREAVRSMEVRGFLSRIHGKGLQVLDNSVSATSRSIADMIALGNYDIKSLFEVREIIEISAAELAAQRATEEDLKKMQMALNVMEISNVMDELYFENDFAFHLCIVRATYNNLLIAMFNACSPLLRRSIVASSQADYNIEKIHNYHKNIYKAICSHDPKGASEQMKIHLLAAKEYYITYEKSIEEKERKV